MAAAAGRSSHAAWTKSMQNLAKVTSIAIANHLKRCGKKEIGEKGHKFFTESYIHNVFVKQEDGRAGTHEVKVGRCYRSQKKSETPHTAKLKIADKEGDGNEQNAHVKRGKYSVTGIPGVIRAENFVQKVNDVTATSTNKYLAYQFSRYLK